MIGAKASYSSRARDFGIWKKLKQIENDLKSASSVRILES